MRRTATHKISPAGSLERGGKRRALVERLNAIKPRSEAGRALAELAWTVHDVYFRLKQPADQLTGPHGQSPSRYALLRDLVEGPATVARIAKARPTARQAIQRVADLLEGDGLVEYVENPSHRRSELLRLTTRGWEIIHRIAEDEAVGFDGLARGFSPAELRTASRVLKAFKARVLGRSHSVSSQVPQNNPSLRTGNLRRGESA